MDTFEFLKYMIKQEHIQLNKLLDKLSDVELALPLSARDNEEDSIGSRLAHTIEAEYRMSTYLYKEDSDNPQFNVNDKSVDDIKSKAEISMSRHLLTLDHLTTDDLNKVWTSEVSGNSYEYKYLLWHFNEHLATHRGQVAMAVNGISD